MTEPLTGGGSVDPDAIPRDVSPGDSGNTLRTAAGTYLIRSEERLRTSTVPVPARRVRLEKYVVTETRTITVQVSREEVRLVDLDLGDASEPPAPGSDRATDHADDVGRWLTLSEERMVVTTEVVPVERVRLDITTVVEQREINETVRREEIDLDPGVPAPQPRTTSSEKDIS